MLMIVAELIAGIGLCSGSTSIMVHNGSGAGEFRQVLSSTAPVQWWCRVQSEFVLSMLPLGGPCSVQLRRGSANCGEHPAVLKRIECLQECEKAKTESACTRTGAYRRNALALGCVALVCWCQGSVGVC